MTTDATPDAGTLTEAERDWLDRIVHVMPYGSDEVRLDALAAAVEHILASRAAAAPEHDGLRAAVEALRDAADDLRDQWVQRGDHPGHPGCYSSGYERWLRDRADALSAAPARTEDTGRDRDTVNVTLTRNQATDLRRWLGMALRDGVSLHDSAANEGRRIIAALDGADTGGGS